MSGKPISGLEDVSDMDDVHVFHAGTKRVESSTVTCGGRVLGVTALGGDLAEARERAYAAVDAIRFEDSYCRRDIASRAIQAGALH